MMSTDFSFSIDIIKFFVLISRLGAFLFAFTFFTSQQIPPKYQILLVLAISLSLFHVLPDNWNNNLLIHNLDLWMLFFIMLSEMVLGITIALFVMIFLETFVFAGFLLDRNIGFAMAKTIDPAGGGSSTVLAGIMKNIFYMSFLIIDGHHEIIRLAIGSFHVLGAGEFMLSESLIYGAVEASSQIFVLGLKLALPVFTVILIVNIGMGLLARIGEDFPVLMLSFPIRIGLGLTVLGIMFPTIVSIAKHVNGEITEWMIYIIA